MANPYHFSIYDHNLDKIFLAHMTFILIGTDGLMLIFCLGLGWDWSDQVYKVFHDLLLDISFILYFVKVFCLGFSPNIYLDSCMCDSTLSLPLACLYLPYRRSVDYKMVMCGRCFATYHLGMILAIFRLDPLGNQTWDPRLIIMIAHDDIDFGIRQPESLGPSLCLSRQCSC